MSRAWNVTLTASRGFKELVNAAKGTETDDLKGSKKASTVFVLVLNHFTWTSPMKYKLAEEVKKQLEAARDSGTSPPILMLHECANWTLGQGPVTDFGAFIRGTPDDLKALNLYGPIAISLQGSRQRQGSLHEAAMKLLSMLGDPKFKPPNSKRWHRSCDITPASTAPKDPMLAAGEPMVAP